MPGQTTIKLTVRSLFDNSGRMTAQLRLFVGGFIFCFAVCGLIIGWLWHGAAPALSNWLALLAGFTLAVAIIIVVAVDWIRTCLYRPLQSVVSWAREIRQGNLTARISADDAGDFSSALDDINRASEWLESLADDKEEQLKEQKSDIERKSRSLTLLYDVVASINMATDIRVLTSGFMHTLADAIGAQAGSIRLREKNGHLSLVDEYHLTSGLHAVEQQAAIHERLLEKDFSIQDITGLCPSDNVSGDGDFKHLKLVVMPLCYLDQVNGVYLFFLSRDRLHAFDELGRLLSSIGRQLGLAVEKSRLDVETNLIPRMQERVNLANELHDSLAQTLASLRFQVRVLDDTLRQNNEAAVWSEMERVESSLEVANTELREIIGHFRAPIDQRGLVPSINAALSRLRKETQIETYFQNQWDEPELPKEVEVQILRIVQESLSNIRKHSGADAARVLLSCEDGYYRVMVEDDGHGFEQKKDNAPSDGHFGLSIMHERAEQIGGEFKIESEPGDGTRVWLWFNADQNVDSDQQEIIKSEMS